MANKPTPESIAAKLINDYRECRAQGNSREESIDEIAHMLMEVDFDKDFAIAFASIVADAADEQ